MTAIKPALFSLLLLISSAGITSSRESAEEAGVVSSHPASGFSSKPFRIFVTNEESGDVTVIDGVTGAIISTWKLGKRPRGVAASPDGQHLFVALSGSPPAGPGTDESTLPPPDKTADGIGVVNTTSGKLERTLRGVSDPEQVAVGLDGSMLYVASEDTGKVLVVESATGKIRSAIDVGGEPEGVAVSPDGTSVYVTSESLNTVAIIDTQSNRELARLAVGQRPREVNFAADGRKAYVTGENDATLVRIDVRTKKIDHRVKVTGNQVRPKGVITSKSDGRVYVTTGRGGTLVAFDSETLESVGSVNVGPRPWGVGLSPDGTRAYTANGPSNDISVVDTRTMQVINKIKVGGRPWGIVVIEH